MKITHALLLFITALARADVAFEIAEPEADNPPAEEVVELPAGLILKGDAHAIAGEIEEALSLWDQAYSYKGAGEKQKRDAIERLQWACPASGIGGLGSEKPGQAFALFRRDSFLGANEALRKRFISEFCDDTEHNQPHPEFDAYAKWLQKMLPEDKNFELLPLILEGDLARNHLWLAQVISRLSNYDFLLEPDRALQVVKLLGGNKAGRSFNAVMLDEDGAQTLMSEIIEHLSSVQESEPDKYKRTCAAVKKFLDGLKVASLDTDLMLTLLQWDDDKALPKFLTKHGSKLAALEPEQQKTILQMLERMKGCPTEGDMDELLHGGDASALAGDREKAKALWAQVMTLSPAGIVPREDAMERLAWARPKGNIETWGPEKPGQAFANHMREIFLGADAVERQALIKTYCTGPDNGNEIQSKFSCYAAWLRNLLAHDKNLELIPLILDGELADHKPWLRLTFSHFNNPFFFSDSPRTIRAMQMLGFLGDVKTFNPRLFDEEANHTAMAFMMTGLQARKVQDLTAIEKVRKRLKELQPRTFGADLVLALLEKDSAAGVTAFLKAHQADIAQLPEATREAVLYMLRKAWPKMPELSAGNKP